MHCQYQTVITSSSAMLWDRTKLDLFSINVQLYSLNHKIAFLSHHMGVPGALYALYLKVLMQRNFVAEQNFIKRMSVLFVKQWSNVSERPFMGVRSNVCDLSLARWKASRRLPIGYKWIFSFYGWDTISENSSKFPWMRLNVRLKGYVYASLYTPSDRGWFYYNFAAGSFHTKKLCSRVYST